jgi:hypothetical protein
MRGLNPFSVVCAEVFKCLQVGLIWLPHLCQQPHQNNLYLVVLPVLLHPEYRSSFVMLAEEIAFTKELVLFLMILSIS